MWTHTHTQTYMHTRTYTYTRTYTLTHTHTHTHTHVCVYIFMYLSIFVNVHIYTHIPLHTYIFITDARKICGRSFPIFNRLSSLWTNNCITKHNLLESTCNNIQSLYDRILNMKTIVCVFHYLNKTCVYTRSHTCIWHERSRENRFENTRINNHAAYTTMHLWQNAHEHAYEDMYMYMMNKTFTCRQKKRPNGK